MKREKIDLRRSLVVAGNAEKTIEYAADHFISCGKEAIKDHGFFSVALSGGSTPKAIYKLLASTHKNSLDWPKVRLFWSDERHVPYDHPDSNYKMAMDAGFSTLSIPKTSIYPMPIEGDVSAYENVLNEKLLQNRFDLMMLGMGADAHTASLFPNTKALKEETKNLVANFIPKLNCWRTTLTYPCINASKNIAIYVIGASKQDAAQKALYGDFDPEVYPIQKVGTQSSPSLWIMDETAKI